MKNTLILTVGLPRIGKSTWAKSTGYPVVNPDSIRLALHGQPFVREAEGIVWEITRIMVRSLFLYDNPVVVLDSCNFTESLRRLWVNPAWETRYKVFPFLPDLCIERALGSEHAHLIEPIASMVARYQPLTQTEKAFPWTHEKGGEDYAKA